MSVFDGRWLWVLDTDDCGGTVNAVWLAKKLGHGICAKWHDGDPADDAKWGFQDKFASLAQQCEAAGVPLLAWGYCYGDTYGNLIKEADAAVDVLTRYPNTGYVIDAESEWEVQRGREWAKKFGDRILSKVPDAKSRLAYCPFWNLRYGHSLYPADAFSTYCSVVMPQCYFDLAQRKTRADREQMFKEMLEDYRLLGLPIYPIGEFSAGSSGVLDFIELAESAGIKDWGWWLFDGYQSSAQLALLETLEGPDLSTLRYEVEDLKDTVVNLKIQVSKLYEMVERIKQAIS